MQMAQCHFAKSGTCEMSGTGVHAECFMSVWSMF